MTELRGIIQATAAIAERRDRADLVSRLDRAARHRDERAIRVVVVGDFKSGKSSLVNALVGASACPVDDDLATAVLTSVASAPELSASLNYKTEQGASLAGATVPVDSLVDLVARGQHDGHTIASISVGLPSELLAGGLELIDTPVLGGLESPEAMATLMGLPFVDALLFVSDTSQEYTAPELAYLERAAEAGTRIICVMSKIDLHPQWRRILEIDLGHLRGAGLDPPILPASARLHELAQSYGDEAFERESGIPALREYLLREVVVPTNAGRDQAVVAEIVAVLDQLESVLRAEHAALVTGETGASLAELRTSNERATALLGGGTRWRQILDDGVEDLLHDVQHQLSLGLREAAQAVGDMVDEGDPVAMEEDYSGWISRQAASVVSGCFQTVARRGSEVADQVVAELASETRGLLVSLEVALAAEPTEQLSFTAHATDGGDEDKVLTAVGGAWGGMEPLLGVAAAVGVVASGPVGWVVAGVAGVAGLFTAGRSFRQEKRRALAADRQRLKDEFKSYLDDVQVRFGKALDDAVRSLNRHLRDEVTTRVSELQRSTRAALEATERAPTVDDSARRAEQADLARELEAVSALRSQARGEVRATLDAVRSGGVGGSSDG